MQLHVTEVMLIVAMVVLVVLRTPWGARLLTLLMPLDRESDKSTGDRCVACNATAVTLLGLMAYRCNACGHEGGDGWPAREEARREALLRREEPRIRRARARRDLREARTLVLSALGTLARAKSEVAEDAAQALTAGNQLLLEARRKALDAQVRLGVSLGVAEVGSMTHDQGLWSGSAHRQMVGFFERAEAMLAAIEAVLRREFPRRSTRTGRASSSKPRLPRGPRREA